MEGRFRVMGWVGACILGALVGCEGDGLYPDLPEIPQASIEIQMTSEPLVTYHAPTGKTNVVVQFIARDASGLALDPDAVLVELLVDGRPVDNEAILRADAEELSASIYLSLVLDASYSMLLHDPPAFSPMREAARDAILQGIELYSGRPGNFDWSLCWFNELIYSPAGDSRSWAADDLLTIPVPAAGTATKLFAAVQREALRMREAYAEVANGPRDHHIMVVFSDGADNYSWFDNSGFAAEGLTSSGAAFAIEGHGVATLESAVTAISDHPKLTTHVIGLGSEVRDSQLQAISAAGSGRYFRNPASSEVGSLFEQVTREFATIQDHGATIPLPPGDYGIGLRVRASDGRAQDMLEFQIHAGDAEARVLE